MAQTKQRSSEYQCSKYQSFQLLVTCGLRDSPVLSAPRYPVDWWDSVLSGTLWTGGTRGPRSVSISRKWICHVIYYRMTSLISTYQEQTSGGTQSLQVLVDRRDYSSRGPRSVPVSRKWIYHVIYYMTSLTYQYQEQSWDSVLSGTLWTGGTTAVEVRGRYQYKKSGYIM